MNLGWKTQNVAFTFIFSNFSGQYQWALTQALSLHLDLSRRELKHPDSTFISVKATEWSQMHCMQLHTQDSRTLVGISNYMCWRDTLGKRTLNLVGNNPSLPWVWQQHTFSKIKTNLCAQNLVGLGFFFEAFLFLPSNTSFWQRVNNRASFKNLKFQRINTFCKRRNIARAPQVVVWNCK